MHIKYYVACNDAKEITGYYNDDVHEEIPDNTFEITEKQWLSALELNANRYIEGEFSYYETELSEDEVSENNLVFRKTTYETESDHLYLEWQFDQTSESEQIWRDKVKEIKERFPL